MSMSPNIEVYKAFVDVFKGYLDTALTANIWFYAVTGAIVTYYLSNREKKDYLKFSLLLPFLLGVLIVYISWKGIGQSYLIERMMLKDAGGDIQLFEVPAVNILVNFLKASISLILFVCLCLIVLFLERPKFLFRNRRGGK
jgi:hypothetical protein